MPGAGASFETRRQAGNSKGEMTHGLEQSGVATASVLPWTGTLLALLPPSCVGAAGVLAWLWVPPAPSVPAGGERAHGAAGLGGHHEEAAVHPAGGLRERPGRLHQPLRRVSPGPAGALAAGTWGCAGTATGGMREAKALGKGAGMPSTGICPGSPPPRNTSQSLRASACIPTSPAAPTAFLFSGL